MALNYIWIAFFIVAFAVAMFRTLFLGDAGVWSEIMSASFTSAATAFEISLGLTGILSQGASGHGLHFHECVGQYAWP